MTSDAAVLGLLYIVDVRMVARGSGEKIKHKLLVVGSEQADIERKLRWMFDVSKYREFSIKSIEKVREKIHFLSTTITQDNEPVEANIVRPDGTVPVIEQSALQERYDPVLYAIGITTTMLGKDETHALRKVGRALIAHATEGQSHTGASLSEDSTISIEAIPKRSGYALPRDVSASSNPARIMRG